MINELLNQINIQDKDQNGTLSLFEYISRIYIFYLNSKRQKSNVAKYFELERALKTLTQLIVSLCDSTNNLEREIDKDQLIKELEKYNKNRVVKYSNSLC